MIKRYLNNILQGLVYCFCNYFVAYIPFWCMRKFLYQCMGMKIGKGSRILMRVTIVSPWKIRLGERVYINEHCYLDGRGGITIGDDSSISIYTYINTGQHLVNGENFEYVTNSVVIADHVWLCAKTNILGGANIESGCVISAGSTAKKGIYEERGIYSGNPAVKIGERKSVAVNYKLTEWKPFFR